MKKSALMWAGTAIAALAVAAPLVATAGFGVSPAAIIENRAIPGAAFHRTLYLVQGNPTEAVPVEVVVESRDIKDWISFDEGAHFTIPAGVQQFPLGVRVAVPDSAPLGVYKAFIRITTVPDAATENGEVAIALGGRVDVNITVGDDIVEDYAVERLEIPDREIGEPLAARLSVVNRGNAPALPDSATFELFDKFGTVRLAFGSVDFSGFERVPAFEDKAFTLEFPLQLALAEGEYWGHVKVFDADGTQLKELRTVFNIVPRGAFAGIAASRVLPWLPPLAGGILVVAAVAFALRRFLRRRNIYDEPTANDSH